MQPAGDSISEKNSHRLSHLPAGIQAADHFAAKDADCFLGLLIAGMGKPDTGCHRTCRKYVPIAERIFAAILYAAIVYSERIYDELVKSPNLRKFPSSPTEFIIFKIGTLPICRLFTRPSFMTSGINGLSQEP
jgi:hypothetical protein